MQSTVLVLAWGYPVLSAFVVKTAIALLGKVGILWKGLWSGVCVVYFPSCSIHLYVSPEFLRENLHLAFPSFWSNIPKLLAPCSASRACAVAGALLRLSCCLRYDSPDGQDALPSQGHHFYHTYKTLCHVTFTSVWDRDPQGPSLVFRAFFGVEGYTFWNVNSY